MYFNMYREYMYFKFVTILFTRYIRYISASPFISWIAVYLGSSSSAFTAVKVINQKIMHFWKRCEEQCTIKEFKVTGNVSLKVYPFIPCKS